MIAENNRVHLQGKVVGEKKLSHTSHDEKFYEYILEVPRLSEITDKIPVIVSEKLLTKEYNENDTLAIEGQYRSFNLVNENKNKLLLNVFARDIIEENEENPNVIELTGFICKEPVYRETPKKREICDILLAVNRAYNKSDYIPLLIWGRNARFSSNLKVGDKVHITGRIQSREYQKKISDELPVENRVAYEVSVASINKLE